MGKTIIGNVLGGVNYTIPPNELPTPNGVSFYASDLQNIVPSYNGYATKRGGSTKYNDTAYTDPACGSIITSFHELDSFYKFCSVGSKIGIYNSSTGNFDDHITGLTSGPTIGTFDSWLNYGGYAIYANGLDNIKKTDGITPSDLTTDESGLAGYGNLAEWGERVWVSWYGTLKASALRAPTDFSTSTVDIGWWSGTVGDEDTEITGIVPFFDMLLIGKRNQIYVLTGSPETASSTFRLAPLQTKDRDSIGFSSNNATAIVGNDLLFLDGMTIKRLSGIAEYGDVESSDILFSIKDYFRSSSGADISKDFLSKSHFFHYKHKEQIWCCFGTDQLTRFWMIIDYSHRELRKQLGLPLYSFYPMSGMMPFCFGGMSNGTITDVYAGFNDGFVRKMDTGTNDSDTAIDAHATWTVGDWESHISPVSLNLSVKYDTACSLTPYYAMGLQDWRDITTSGNYTAMETEDLTDSSWVTTGSVSHKLFNSFYANTGKSFSFKLRHNTASQTFEMRSSLLRHRKRFNYYG
jgi:hypothetical protein